MIHDIDIVLALVGAVPEEIRAAGISVLSENVDIANVRLQFATGCVANLTASRVSTEKVRKLRLFQPRQYLSLDYSRQDLFLLSVDERRQVTPHPVFVNKSEPLQNQFVAFLESIRSRRFSKTSGACARQSLEVALAILDKIKEHSELVSKSLTAGWNR
jgi:predicted dehydrogenase